jgi:hypothetical protein
MFSRMMWTPLAAVAASMLLIGTGQGAIIAVTASQDLNLRRGPLLENGATVHVKQSTNDATDRVGMFRFDSVNFGTNVTAATFLLTANPDSTVQFQGTYDFRVYGVIDGDPQDEMFTEGGYDPAVAGSIYDGSDNLIAETQLVTLGDFTAAAGTQVALNTANLLAFVQGDTNGVVTLVVERLSLGANSTFLGRVNQDTPPRLQLDVIPEPATFTLFAAVGLLARSRRRR